MYMYAVVMYTLTISYIFPQIRSAWNASPNGQNTNNSLINGWIIFFFLIISSSDSTRRESSSFSIPLENSSSLCVFWYDTEWAIQNTIMIVKYALINYPIEILTLSLIKYNTRYIYNVHLLIHDYNEALINDTLLQGALSCLILLHFVTFP